MKIMKNNHLTSTLLSWVSTKVKMDKAKVNEKDLKIGLEEIEDELAKENISGLSIMHQSPDYFTLCYLKEGNPYIKQFTTEEVENAN